MPIVAAAILAWRSAAEVPASAYPQGVTLLVNVSRPPAIPGRRRWRCWSRACRKAVYGFRAAGGVRSPTATRTVPREWLHLEWHESAGSCDGLADGTRRSRPLRASGGSLGLARGPGEWGDSIARARRTPWCL